jgi:hypothetical protein
MTEDEKNELEILTRVGWQKWLDTPEGRQQALTDRIIVEMEEIYCDLDTIYFKNGKVQHQIKEIQEELKSVRDRIKNLIDKHSTNLNDI